MAAAIARRRIKASGAPCPVEPGNGAGDALGAGVAVAVRLADGAGVRLGVGVGVACGVGVAVGDGVGVACAVGAGVGLAVGAWVGVAAGAWLRVAVGRTGSDGRPGGSDGRPDGNDGRPGAPWQPTKDSATAATIRGPRSERRRGRAIGGMVLRRGKRSRPKRAASHTESAHATWRSCEGPLSPGRGSTAQPRSNDHPDLGRRRGSPVRDPSVRSGTPHPWLTIPDRPSGCPRPAR
jgi:hypothetical protein